MERVRPSLTALTQISLPTLFPLVRTSHVILPRCKGAWEMKSWMGNQPLFSDFTVRKGRESLGSYPFFPRTLTWFHLRDKKASKWGSQA